MVTFVTKGTAISTEIEIGLTGELMIFRMQSNNVLRAAVGAKTRALQTILRRGKKIQPWRNKAPAV